MREVTGRIRELAAHWTAEQFERSYAPGKWTARQILIHLAQSEIALGNRARMALATPNYSAQAFDQDSWMAIEAGPGGSSRSGGPDRSRESDESRGSGERASGDIALSALVAMNALNRALFESLTPAQRATPFTHPEYGALTVDWLIHQMAGHLVHHCKQLEGIGGR